MTFVIEKNIQVPSKKYATDFPFAQMENGDSFVIPIDGKEPHVIRSSIFTSAKSAKVKVATRTVPDGIRVWKLKSI